MKLCASPWPCFNPHHLSENVMSVLHYDVWVAMLAALDVILIEVACRMMPNLLFR